ncbi:hypothetical protein [Chryseobacterium polytrichastri]|uniref:Polyketide cyclase / dehydrase and lipid transport n=1 Tax=Chryseobacterium polytrichastri TaxID=1302687 RepID=A0A1M7CUM1_9FLAO|nr:hypothetical protein [Chryseobacterium polytrichastri]SHL70951.1 hypothetical protein SAMN05444267_102323 [Chryseobacterium polytrichastri]
MRSLNFKPFSKDELINGLKKTFPQYKIQTSFGALQVRTSGFTLTGNVKINAKPEIGKVTTETASDSALLYLIFCFPIGIYMYMKKERIKKLENEVIEGIQKILVEDK